MTAQPPYTEKVNCYLVLEASSPSNPYWKGARIVRMTKGKPSLERGQIAVKVNLNVPGSIFEELIPTFDLDISPENVIAPIDAELETTS